MDVFVVITVQIFKGLAHSGPLGLYFGDYFLERVTFGCKGICCGSFVHTFAELLFFLMSLKAGISSAVVPEHEASKVVDLAAKPKTEVGIIEKA